jgi:hypothetical protein
MLSLTERRALAANSLMRFEQNRETPEEDQLVGAWRQRRHLTAGKSASGVPVPTVSELMCARHARDALSVLSAMSKHFMSCSSSLS